MTTRSIAALAWGLAIATGLVFAAGDRRPAGAKAFPTAQWLSPAHGSVIEADEVLTLKAWATQTGGSIARVEFMESDTRIGTAITPNPAPSTYVYDWPGPPVGPLVLKACAFGADATQTCTTPPVRVTVLPAMSARIVTLTSVVTGTPLPHGEFSVGEAVRMTATLEGGDQRVSRVEFYCDGALVHTDSTAPFRMDWVAPGAQVCEIRARAFNDRGQSPLSAPVAVKVLPGSTPYGGLLRSIPLRLEAENFDAGGESVAYHDTTAGNQGLWPQELGPYRATDVDIWSRHTYPAPPNHRLTGIQPDEWLDYSVLVPAPGDYTLNVGAISAVSGGELVAQVLGSGASELVRVALPFGEAAQGASAHRALHFPEAGRATVRVWFEFQGVPDRDPYNVEFDWLEIAALDLQTPRITLTAPLTGTQVTGPRDVTFTALASDPDGSIAYVAFYRYGEPEDADPDGNVPFVVSLGQDTTFPYQAQWPQARLGQHAAWAIAVDNSGRSAVSNFAVFTVIEDQPPAIAITTPIAGQQFMPTTPVALTVLASDPEGRIDRVEYFAGAATAPFATVIAAPYSTVWTGSGAYNGQNVTLRARVFDELGAWRESSVSVAILSNTGPSMQFYRPWTGPEEINCPRCLLRWGRSIHAVGSSLRLDVVVNDNENNIARVEFWRRFSPASGPITATQTEQLLTVTAATGSQRNFVTDLVLTEAHRSERLQEIYAIAYDTGGATATSLIAPIAVTPANPPAIPCEPPPSGSGICHATRPVIPTPGQGQDGLVQAERYEQGGHGVGYFIPRRANGPAANYRRQDEVATVLGAPGTPGAYPAELFVTDLRMGDQLVYAIDVQASGVYRVMQCSRMRPVSGADPVDEATAPSDRAPATPAESSGVRFHSVDEVGARREVKPATTEALEGVEEPDVTWTCPLSALDPAWTSFTISADYSLMAGQYEMTIDAVPHGGITSGHRNNPIDIDAFRLVRVDGNAGTSVALTSPADGAIYALGTVIPLQALPNGTPLASGSPRGLRYERGSSATGPWTLVAADVDPPYTATWQTQGLTDGNYWLRVCAVFGVSNQPCSAASRVTLANNPNRPPNATLTAPAAGQQFALGAPIALTAIATDDDGSITRVDFYRDVAGSPVLIGQGVPGGSPSQYRFSWSGAASGSHTLFARAIDNANPASAADSAPVTITVVEPSSGAVSETPDAPATPAPRSNGVQPGAVAGEFKVDETGAANYHMPIFVPPGAGGVVPQLALQYASTGGDGYLGQGFALGGLSALSRCRKTVEHGDGPGPHPAVDFSAYDQYCADGQRLLLVNGTHGALQAEYRTEIDSFQKITVEQRGSAALDPEVFAIQAKDGTRRRYGESGARVTATVNGSTRVVSWLLSSIEDNVGNRITFSYESTERAGELLAKRVSYRGGRVTFDYTAPGVTAPVVVSYAAGVPVYRSRLLARIEVEAEKTAGVFEPVRRYKLGYQPMPNGAPRVRIRTVQECAPLRNADDVLMAGESCYAPTTFSWNDLLNSMETIVSGGGARDFFDHLSALKYGDVDGDGRADMIWNNEEGNDTLRMAYAAPRSGGLDLEPYGFGANGIVSHRSSGYSNDRSWHLFDFDADGREDLLEAVAYSSGMPSSGRWLVRLSQATPTTRQSDPFQALAVSPTLDGTDISFTETRTDGLLADFNGDGLTDLVTIVRSGGIDRFSLRLLRRNPNFNPIGADPRNRLALLFGPAQTLNLPAITGSCELVTLDRYNREHSEAFDVDGDGAADLKLRGELLECKGDRQRLISPDIDLDDLPAGSPDAAVAVPAGTSIDAVPQVRDADAPSAPNGGERSWLILRNPGISANTTLVSYASFVSTGAGAVVSDDPENFRVADINGDGLADVLYKAANDLRWYFRLNTGKAYADPVCADADGAICNQLTDKVALSIQLLDYDGDGRLDFWRRGSNDPCRADGTVQISCYYRVLLWNGTAFQQSSNFVLSRYVAEAGLWTRYFADADGDGLLDGINIEQPSGNWETRRYVRASEGGASRVPLRNLVRSVDNGMGAVTRIDYAPLTFASVYQRDFDALTRVFGRDSAAFDLVAPSYVVSAAASSAPAENEATGSTDFAALSHIYYRYAGLKMQGGGRGSLGFRKVFSTDVQTGIETETTYGQNFPLMNVPLESRAVLRSAVRPIYFACDLDSDSAQCHRRTPMCATGPSTVCDVDAVPGTELSRSLDEWHWRQRNATSAGSSLAAQVPLFVYRVNSSKTSNEFGSGVATQAVDAVPDGSALSTDVTEFLTPPAGSGLNCFEGYDAYGNVCRTRVRRHAGTAAGALVTETDSVFWYGRDVPANWILGRLTASRVTTSREVNGVWTSRTRNSTFDYRSDGLLQEEHVQRYVLNADGSNGAAGPIGEALSTYYDYDDSGNKTGTHTCSRHFTEATCRDTGALDMQPSDPLMVQRYSRVEYDDLGRFVQRTYSAAQGIKGFTEVLAGEVNRRTATGEPMEATDANGLKSYAAYEALGRKYWERASNGSWKETRTDTCSGQCPAGAFFVVSERAGGAPRRWSYHDALGRAFATATEGFGSGQWVATQQRFDALGRVVGASTPYFAANNQGGVLQAAAGSTVFFATTRYDVLGRAVQSTATDGGVTDQFYDGLRTETTVPPNGQGDSWSTRQWKITTRSVAGEISSVLDANQLTLRYGYDSYGTLIKVEQIANASVLATTTMSYDGMGRKTGMTDPDLGGRSGGSWFYAVNAAGETVKQAGPRGTCSESSFDALGRLHARRDFTGNTDVSGARCNGTRTYEAAWRFDTTVDGVAPAATAIGKPLAEVAYQNGVATPLTQRRYSYDAQQRPDTIETVLDNRLYRARATYDRYSRSLHTLFAAPDDGIAEFGEFASYNARGYSDAMRDAAGSAGELLSQVEEMNAQGQATRTVLGAQWNDSPLATQWGYDAATGRLTSIYTGAGQLQSLVYAYDRVGNMLSRGDNTAGRNLLERFKYDSLQRLSEAAVGANAVAYQYDNNGAGPGNLSFRSDLGSYAYGNLNASCNQPGEVQPGPHAATAAGSMSYCYDRHGNQTRSSEGRSISYTAFDLPYRATHTGSGKAIAWDYGPNRERLRRLDYDSVVIGALAREVTHYIGNVEVIRDSSGTLQRLKRHAGASVTIYERSGNAYPRRREFLLAAAQGSTYAVISATGTVVGGQVMAFDAFGMRRNAETWSALSRAAQLGFDTTATTRKGYTGHDQADSIGLIHMNGRIYDPQLARFVQADPTIQDPYAGQSFNRYTYVFNNPLAYTDPTGYMSFADGLRMVVAIAITVYTGGAAAGTWTFFGTQVAGASAFAVVVAGGIAAGAVQTGTMKGALSGGLSAAMFYGVGSYFQGAKWAYQAGKLTAAGWAAKSLAHGLVGGTMSKLQGGNFGHGFASAGFSAAMSPFKAYVAGSHAAGQIITSAVIGGTASAISGGKFENGAVTAAMAAAFNAWPHGEYEEYEDAGRWEGAASFRHGGTKNMVGTTLKVNDEASVALDVIDIDLPIISGSLGFTDEGIGSWELSGGPQIKLGPFVELGPALAIGTDGFFLTGAAQVCLLQACVGPKYMQDLPASYRNMERASRNRQLDWERNARAIEGQVGHHEGKMTFDWPFMKYIFPNWSR